MSDIEPTAVRLQALIRDRGIPLEYELTTLMRAQTVAGIFVHDVLSSDELSDDERLRVLVTGLRALDGRDDLEVS